MTAWEALKEAPRRFNQAASQARPTLRSIVSPPRRISPIPFAVLMVALLVGGMVLLLLLTTALQNQAFQVREAQRQANELGYRVSSLESRVTQLNSPASLGREAAALGMVPNPHAVFIDLETGTVIGKPTKVTGQEIPSLIVLPPAPETPPVEEGTAAAPPDPAAGTPLTPGEAPPATPVAGDAAPEAGEVVPAPVAADAPATDVGATHSAGASEGAATPAADAEVHGDPGVPSPTSAASAAPSEPAPGVNA
ncbi:MAG: hypothetical protein ACLGHZ_11570 [Actinomycetes bacterium]